MTNQTVTNIEQRPGGLAAAGVIVYFDLVTSGGGGFDATDSLEIVGLGSVTSGTDGSWSKTFVPNSLISPGGNYYTATRTIDGQTLQDSFLVPASGGPFLLGNILYPTPGSIPSGVHSETAHSGDVLPDGANQAMGAAYLQLSQMTAPTAPSAGSRRLFEDATGGHLKIRTDVDTQDLEQLAVDPGLVLNALLGWTFDMGYASGATALPTAATVFLSKVALPRRISVTNVLVYLGTLGATLTHSYVAAYTSAGILIGQSADQSSIWGTGGSTGAKTIALSGGPFTVTPTGFTDFLWTAIYVGTSSGALPQFQRAATNTAGSMNANLTAAIYRAASQAVADTATLPNLTPSSNVSTANLYWAGIA